MKTLNHQPGTLFFECFVLDSWIWIGSPSSVFCCHDTTQNMQKVALKLIDRSLVRDPHIIERFLKEIDLLNSFSHPNIIDVYQVFLDDKYIGFSMPYFDRGTLADELCRESSISLRRVMLLLSQVLRGLAAIHEAGILHRDLKPENILIDDEGFIQIADFGIACEVSDFRQMENSGISGTISYVSPEYIEYGQCDERSDIYAVGAILYELVTGSLPYKERSLMDTIKMKVKSDPLPPIYLRSDCPAKLSEIVMRAMARKPENRYQSVAEMIVDLETHLPAFKIAMFSNIAWKAAA